MLEPRTYASAVVLDDQKLWITGGYGKTRYYSTEFVYIDTKVPEVRVGPDLPVRLEKHCTVKLNNNTGVQDTDSAPGTAGGHWQAESRRIEWEPSQTVEE